MSLLAMTGVFLRDGTRTMFRGLDLRLERGERLVVFGPQGSGKRALLKAAAGVLAPDAGDIRLDAGDRPAPVGWVTREGGLLNNMTLVQNAALPLVYHGLAPRREAESAARTMLAELGLTTGADARPALVTPSSRLLAQLARAFLVKPALFVLESPLLELDAESAAAVRGALGRIREDASAAAIAGTSRLGRHYLDWGTRFLMVHGQRLAFFASREALLAGEDPDLKLYLK